MGVLLDERDGQALPHSPCIRCDAFDGYPLPDQRQGRCADHLRRSRRCADCPNLTLLTGAYVERLVTGPERAAPSPASSSCSAGQRRTSASADIVVVACGALSSALLLLRSANDAHPRGSPTAPDQVGRNYMRHNNATVLAISQDAEPDAVPEDPRAERLLLRRSGPTDDWDFPLGHIQMVGKSDGAQIHGEGLPGFLQWFPDKPFDWIAKHSVDFWLTSEDLPRPQNRVFYKDGQGPSRPHRDATWRRTSGSGRSCATICSISSTSIRTCSTARSTSARHVPIGGTAHQAGTLRFGDDPATSVLDRDCKAHELDNLYVTDASFFPSIGAVNPTLTIIANALRVADHLVARMGARDEIPPPRLFDHTEPREPLPA